MCDSSACAWDPCPPTGFPHAAVIGVSVSSLAVTCKAMFSGYPWEACSSLFLLSLFVSFFLSYFLCFFLSFLPSFSLFFIKKNRRGLDLQERRGRVKGLGEAEG